jgi:hypothetical protein
VPVEESLEATFKVVVAQIAGPMTVINAPRVRSDRPHIACLTRPLQIDSRARHLGFIIFRQMLINMSRFGHVFRTNNQE